MIGLNIYNSEGVTIINSESLGTKILKVIDVNGRKNGEEKIDIGQTKNIIAFSYPLLHYGQTLNIVVNNNVVRWEQKEGKGLKIYTHYLSDTSLDETPEYSFNGRIIIPHYSDVSDVLPEKIICMGY